ncbi:MAG: CHAT domain-containing protein, partial [Prochloraceae cyanobacterium]
GANIVEDSLEPVFLNSVGGDVSLNSTEGAIATGNINSSGTTGGDVTLNSATTITTENINSSGSNGDGGDVTLNSVGNIRVLSIKADGTNQGGNIEVNRENNNPPFFVAEGFIANLEGDFSIFTDGASGGGVTIRHGGDSETPFQVGFGEDPNVINGTAGTIKSRETDITADSFAFTEFREDIGIISSEAFGGGIFEIVNLPTPRPYNPKDPGSDSNFTADNQPLKIGSITEARKILRQIEKQSAAKPALVYVSFAPQQFQVATNTADEYFVKAETCLTEEYQAALGLQETEVAATTCFAAQPNDLLEILVVTPEGDPIYISGEKTGVTRSEVEKQAEILYREVANKEELWQAPAEQLYKWLIGNIEAELATREISNLLFVLPAKLRSLPLAALYDWESDQFLVQKGYNVGLAPSVNLMNTVYNKDIFQNASVLAFGSADFEEDQEQQALKAVEFELPQIINLRGGRDPVLNEEFTLENLQTNLDQNSVPIVHLSTHADFNTQSIDDIYIQLYNRKLTLDELRSLELKIGSDDLELLVLSACRSAFGDLDAELGFAGLAIKLGVKTAIGSLWQVSDVSTPGLMIEFYNYLKTAPFKAEALGLAQIAMIEEKITIDLENRQMITSWGEVIELPETVVADLLANNITELDLSHPYYWAPFTVIGSPW